MAAETAVRGAVLDLALGDRMEPITAGLNKALRASSTTGRGNWLKLVRQWHLYLGVFFAPSIVFFALSGVLQILGLHEGHKGDTYQPPAWIAAMASIHKKQTLDVKQGPPPGGAVKPKQKQAAQAPRDMGRKESPATPALKFFFLVMSAGLILTTCLGVYMGFKYNRSRVLVWGLLIVGTVIPVALVAFMV